MPINFTQFLSADAFTEDDWFVGYRGVPIPGKERKWGFTNTGTPPSGDTEPTSPNEGGSDSTFFIMADGTLRFAGLNTHFHGGIGGVRSDVVIVPRTVAFSPPLAVGEKVTKVYVQKTSSFVVTSNGSVYTAGYNGHYQLGTGNNVNQPVFKRILKSTNDGIDTATVLNPAGDKVVALSPGCGNGNTNITVFAITQQGFVWSWGYNGGTLSRAGVGNTASSHILQPTQVTAGLPAADPVVQVTNGGWNGTQVCYVRTQSGKLLSIGEGATGASGAGANIDIKQFTQPTGLPSGYVAVDVICAGEANYLSTWVILNNGDVYATGYNDDKQVNPSSTATWQYSFAKITALSNITRLVIHPDSGRTTIWALGGPHGAYTSLVGWGDNQKGQLGTGNVTAQATPTTPIAQPYFAGGKTIRDMVIGGNDGLKTTAIIDSGDLVWTSGYNGTGLLGNGTLTDSSVFQRCLINPNFGKPKKLRSGANGYSSRTYFMCRMDTGKLLAWGWDSASVGQLAVDTSPSVTPIPSPVLLLF